MSKIIDLDASDSVAILRLNNPPVNALNETALDELARAVNQVEHDSKIRVVIVTSAIRGVFCAGGDLKYWPRHYANRPDLVSEVGQRTFKRVEQLSKPTIAAIQGNVIGDGLSLVLACDLRLASRDASFQLPEVSYGFIPGWGTIGRLVESVGSVHAAELLLVGERITAAAAQAIGLINRQADPGDLMSVAEAVARRLATQPPMAIRYAKAALHGEPGTASPDRAAWEASCFAAVWGSQEWRQGLEKFFNAAAVIEPEGVIS